MEAENNLTARVGEWLTKEGYPLEFAVAGTFQKHRFSVSQGYYVSDAQSGALREIDVLASATTHVNSSLLRVKYVVECKWSKDKPWVVFSSSRHHIAPSACIAQTIGSDAGHALLWSFAGDSLLQSMDAFSTPQPAGFNGRQAFSKDRDVFYNAMQSVANASNSIAADYDLGTKSVSNAVRAAVIVFPIIVIEGELLEASLDSQSGHMRLVETDRIRIHWRGAESSRFPFTTIDLVTATGLDDFVESRSKETQALLNCLAVGLEQLQQCVKDRSLRPLTILGGSRGITGMPNLLRRIGMLAAQTDNDSEENTLSPRPDD